MRFRFPMFLKFWVGCALLAALLIVGGLLVVKKETRVRSRGFYLERHYTRFTKFNDRVGRSLSSVTDVLASDPILRSALAGETPPQPIVTGPVAPTPPAPAASAAEARAEEMFAQVSSKQGVQPDWFLVIDERGGLVWSAPNGPISADDLRELEIVSRVKQGTAVLGRLLVHGDRAWQVAAVPVTAPKSRRVVGAVMMGLNIERTMKEFLTLGDDNRLVFVNGGRVLASVFPTEVWSELNDKLKEPNWGEAPDGEETRKVIVLKEGQFDFHHGAVEGLSATGGGPVGELFLLRLRTADQQQTAAPLPWKEILIGAILSLIVASLLALWITRPIKRFVSQSQRMLEGGADLNQRIEIRSSDETADLAKNINQVFSRLFQLASEVQGAAFQVGASSAEISAASKQMSEGLRDQTMKIESSTAAVTELSASIQQVASNAVEATKVAEKSNVAVQAAVDRMQQIRGSVETAADKMTELGESSKRIGNIVEVIRQISEQTSLLALNASIEAAHAGEQGRGFAVVADEVSSLARRVGQSAKDIEALIQTIKEQTSEAVHSMQVGAREVEGGTELVTNTLRDLRQLIHVVKDTAVAVQEQAMVSDEIARNMDAVQKIAAEMVSGSEEAVLQGDQLHTLAFNLEQSVGMFNIDGSGSGGAARPHDDGGNGSLPPPRSQRPPALRGASSSARRP